MTHPISETMACVLVVLCTGGGFCFGWLAGGMHSLREWKRGYDDACAIWKTGYYELLRIIDSKPTDRGCV